MISLKNIFIVFKKEFLQLMRDKSVIMINFFLPLFSFPLYFILIAEIGSYAAKKAELPLGDDTVFSITVQGDPPRRFKKMITTDKKIKIKSVKKKLNQELVKNYRENFREYLVLQNSEHGKLVNVVAEGKKDDLNTEKKKKIISDFRTSKSKIRSQFESQDSDVHLAFFRTEHNTDVVYLFYHEENKRSEAARRYLKAKIEKYKKSERELLLKSKKIIPTQLAGIYDWEVNVNPQGSKVSVILANIFSGMLIMGLFIMVLMPAMNTTIGERDDNTYKVLLMNPISLYEIFFGKYLNVALQGVLALLPYLIQSLVGYIWLSSFPLVTLDFPEITPKVFLTVSFSVLAMAILITSFVFFICSLVRTKVQAQSLLSFLMFAVLVPIGAVSLFGLKLGTGTAFIPVANLALTMEALFDVHPDYFSAWLAILTNFTLSVLLVGASLKPFSLQWRGGNEIKGLGDLLVLKRRKSKELIPAHGIIGFALCALGVIYGGFVFSIFKDSFVPFFFTPIFFSFGPTVFILWYSGLDFVKVFKWKALSFQDSTRTLLAAVFLSISVNLFFYSTGLFRFFNYPLPEFFRMGTFSGYIGYFVIFALLPGIFEELLFRGIIYQGFRRQMSVRWAAILSSVLFALIHISFARWAHTFLLGIFLAILFERRGIVHCIVMHIVFNSTSLLLGFFKLGENTFSALSGATGILMAGLLLVLGAILFAPFWIQKRRIDFVPKI